MAFNCINDLTDESYKDNEFSISKRCPKVFTIFKKSEEKGSVPFVATTSLGKF